MAQSLAEAFRALLRERYPQQPELADDVTSGDWFRWPTMRHNWPPEAIAAAKSAHAEILATIRDRRPPLRGFNERGEPADIDPLDVATGRIKIFENAIEVALDGKKMRTWRRVELCDATIVPPTGELLGRVSRHRRFATDAALAQRAVKGINSSLWSNPHQAALALAHEAPGASTVESKVRRLEGKISNLLETSRNISKD
jgi:hypothetical protein